MSAITDALSRWGALRAMDLAQRVAAEFGSQRSVQRAVKADPRIVRLGRTTRSAYAMRRSGIRDAPVLMRDEHGQDHHVGTLVALAADQWLVAPTGITPAWMNLGTLQDIAGVYPNFPWFLDNLRPAGFLGRTWVRAHAGAMGWPEDLTQWTDEQVVAAASEAPWDWRGNLGLEVLRDGDEPALPSATRFGAYAERARAVLDGATIGASAEGEQPKFTARLDDGRTVLVKFSHIMTGHPSGRRWGDILVTEAVAAQVMALHALTSASTQVWRHADRVWLEADLFDRVPGGGRHGLVSLRSLARGFSYSGPQGNWLAPVGHLERRGAVERSIVEQASRLGQLGQLLANTDMHLGNLSFLLSPTPPLLALAPVYDMAPMMWAPLSSGAVPELTRVKLPAVDDPDMLRVAQEIWTTTAAHELVSDEWRRWAMQRSVQIGEALTR